MSTKNLSRTVIEGGRRSYNKFERHRANSDERIREARVSRQLLDGADPEDAVYPRRQPVYQGFDDKLAPAKRWLTSQVGRPWDKVRGELMQRFDTRTTAGRHIVFDHLLPSVERHVGRFGRPDFDVDRHGFLRAVPRRRFRFAHREPLPVPEAALVDWLAGRRVGERGTVLYWFVPTPTGSYRQAKRLSESDAARFRRLPRWFRKPYDALVWPGEEGDR